MTVDVKPSLSHMLTNVMSRLLKGLFVNSVTSKVYEGTSSNLYYERSQHLMFAFKKVLTYEPVVQNKVKQYIHSGDLVFDIGGNIGQYTLLFSDLVGAGGKVVTLEPDYKNFSFLQFNVNINNLSNVFCLKKGVSDTNKIVEFYRDTETGGRKGSFGKEYVGSNFKGNVDQVESVTFDCLIEKFGQPNFVKIDVEGFETNVVRGLTQSLNSTTFVIEVRNETKKEVFDYFYTRGYRCYHIDYHEDILIENSSQIPEFANLIFRKE